MAEIGEAAGIVGGMVTVLGIVGGGVKWLFATRDSRQKMIDDAVNKAFADLRKELTVTKTQLATLSTIYFMLAGELSRQLPDSPVLREANRLFNLAFAVPADTPDAMADLLDELHERTR